MTYNSFYTWVRENRILSVPLILLFIFGTIFQVTDTFERVKGWFTPETHNILHIKSHVDFFDDDEGEANLVEGDEDALRQISLTTKVHENAAFIKALLEGSHDLWLVRVEGTDVLQAEKLADGSEFEMRVGLMEAMPFAIQVLARDGEASMVVHIQFPNIDPNRPWADFESVPISCCQGEFKHTAFYRFVEYKDKGQLPNTRNFKAQYIDPDASLAQSLLDEVDKGKYEQLYFEDKTDLHDETNR